MNLLADVFESFREFNLKHYKLNPAHFLSRSAFLKYTRVKLELSTNPNMNALFDQGLIGRISFIASMQEQIILI